MDKNILDKATDKLLSTLNRVDDLAKNAPYYPYGKVKATPAEKRTQFENLDVNQVVQLIDKYGKDKVNEYLRRNMEVQ